MPRYLPVLKFVLKGLTQEVIGDYWSLEVVSEEHDHILERLRLSINKDSPQVGSPVSQVCLISEEPCQGRVRNLAQGALVD